MCFHSLSTEAREALVLLAGPGGVGSKLRIVLQLLLASWPKKSSSQFHMPSHLGQKFEPCNIVKSDSWPLA